MKTKIILLIVFFIGFSACKNKTNKKDAKKTDESSSLEIETIKGEFMGENTNQALNTEVLFDNDPSTIFIIERTKYFTLQSDKNTTITKIRINDADKKLDDVIFYPVKEVFISGPDEENNYLSNFQVSGNARFAELPQPVTAKHIMIRISSFMDNEGVTAIGDLAFSNGKNWFVPESNDLKSVLSTKNMDKNIENSIYNAIYNTHINPAHRNKYDQQKYDYNDKKQNISLLLKGKESLRNYTNEIEEYIMLSGEYENIDNVLNTLGSDNLEFKYECTGYWQLDSKENNILSIVLYGYETHYSQEFIVGYDYYNMEPPIIYSDSKSNLIVDNIKIDISKPVEKESVITLSDIEELYFQGINRPLSYSDIEHLSIDDLAYLRNEFYARKGYKFKTKKMQKYFGDKLWYTPEHDDVTDLLSETELENIFFIKNVEEGRKINEEENIDELIESLYKEGQIRKYSKSELKDLNIHQLGYLRNEFFAHKGYIFKTRKYREYFSKKSWYKPQHDSSEGLLSDIEIENVEFIRSLEQELKSQ